MNLCYNEDTMDDNATYLRDNVGEVLSKGIAATTLAQPSDPVEFLATWLLKHVEGKAAELQYLQQKKDAQGEALLAEDARIKAVRAAEEVAEQQAADVDSLTLLRGEPVMIWRSAADLVRRHTSAKCAYVAQVIDPAEPDWSPPPDDENAGNETDDDNPPVKEDEPEEGEGESAGDEPADGGDAPKLQLPKKTDYSNRALAYVAATFGQEWLVGKQLLRAAKAADEAEGEDSSQQAAASPVTFRLLDEQMPLLHVPVVAREPRMTFFKPYPKIGAYMAAAMRTPSGDYQSILAADTLVPEGHGQVFSQVEQDFIWQVAQAASQAVAASQAALFSELAEAADVCADTTALQALLDKLHSDSKEAAAAAGFKAVEAGEEGEGEGQGEGEGGGEPPAEEAAEEGEDAVANATAKVALVTAQVTAMENELERTKEAVAAFTAALEFQEQALAAVQQAVQTTAPVAVKALRGTCALPQSTYHVLKAVMHLLGRPAASFDTWTKAQALVKPELFDEVVAYDAKAPRDMEVWKRVRSCYKAVKGKAVAGLETELPPSKVGLLLLLWVKEVRRMAKRAAALRDQQKKLETTEKLLQTRRTELEAANVAQAKAEEEAARAAEAAAAEEAAAAAAAEAEQEQEDE